jgi:protein TonB
MTMDRRDDEEEDDGRSWGRRYGVAIGSGVLVLALLVTGVLLLLSGDKNPPHKVQEFTIVNILPPPPPPPPPQARPEPKVVEQTPVKNEIIEDKPVEKPKEAPPKDFKNDEPPPGPLALAAKGEGPGDLFGLGGNPGGRGFLGGGGGGGGSRWGWYASIVQSQIEAALRANQKTRNMVAQLQAKLWSDAAGRITRVQLVSSSGNPELDAAVRDEVLSGLTLREPPPKDMPMPIVTRVTARKAS